MAIVELPAFKAYLGTELSKDDAPLSAMLGAAERTVEQFCGRRFTLAATDIEDATTRVFVPTTRWTAWVDDFTQVDSIVNEGTTVEDDYYQLEPLNGISLSGEPRPYDSITRLYGFWYRNGIKATLSVTATWGWPEIPEQVKQAVLMVGKDIRSSKDTAYGIAAYTEYAAIRIRENPQVAALLMDLRKGRENMVGGVR